MKYSENVDYLVSSIIYLGTHEYYWARSARALSRELSLDEARLQELFNAFPGLFRRSERLAEHGQHYYALQARYAQREGGDVSDPEKVSYIAPLNVEKMKMLMDFVLKMTEHERVDSRLRWTHVFSIVAAVLSALTAIIVGTGMLGAKQSAQKAAIFWSNQKSPLQLRSKARPAVGSAKAAIGRARSGQLRAEVQMLT